jgi:CRP-like cAMP-binding protein
VSPARGDARRHKDDAAAAMAAGRWRKALESYLVLERLEPSDGVWAQRAGDILRRLGKDDQAVEAWKRAADLYSRGGFLVKAIAVFKLILEVVPGEREALAQLASLHAERGFGAGSGPRRLPVATQPSAPPPRLEDPERNGSAVIPEFSLPDAEPEDFAAGALEVIAPGADAAEEGADDDEIPISLADLMPFEEIREPSRRTIPPGQTLGDVPLGRLVRGATRSDQFPPVGEGDAAVYEIPLDDEQEVSFEGLLEETETPPPADERTRTLFRRTPLFSSLDERRLLFLIERSKLVQLEPGQILFRVGDPGDALYVIADGEVAVASDPEGTQELARLGDGAFFGEIAIVARRPRNATIRATRATTLLALEVETIGALVANEPEVLKILLRFMRDRLVSRLVATSPIFAPFSRGERAAIASRFRVLEAQAGVTLLEEGKRSPGVFVVLSGKVAAFKGNQEIATLSDGDLFGETSLLTQEPARVTLRATTQALFYELPRAEFQELIMTHPQILEYMTVVADERRRLLDERLAAGRYTEGSVRSP